MHIKYIFDRVNIYIWGHVVCSLWSIVLPIWTLAYCFSKCDTQPLFSLAVELDGLTPLSKTRFCCFLCIKLLEHLNMYSEICEREVGFFSIGASVPATWSATTGIPITAHLNYLSVWHLPTQLFPYQRNSLIFLDLRGKFL